MEVQVIEAQSGVPTSQDLRWLVDLYYQVQKLRVALGNRASAIERGADTGDALFARHYEEMFHNMERSLVKDIERLVRQHVTWPWLSRVKGVGPVLAGKLVGLCGPDEAMARRDTVSKLWAFAGLAPGQRLVKGQKATFNRRLKTTVWLCGTSFLRSRSKFEEVYRSARAYYDANRPEWTPAHRHLAAMRKMGKVFLACLWQVWREGLGLPVRALYVQEKLGHQNVRDPWEFVE